MLDSVILEISKYDVDSIIAIENQILSAYDNESFVAVLDELVLKLRPNIFLIGGTLIGRTLAPSLASSLNTGLTADCTGLYIDTKTGYLHQVRPAFGGSLLATIACPERRPQMATVRPGVFVKPSMKTNFKLKIFKLSSEFHLTPDVKVVRSVAHNISDAIINSDIIVAFGRGVGYKKNLSIIDEFCRLLDASIGASRAVVDAGWIDYKHQIGQTGKTVAPKLYIALGISGAVQHIAGILTAKCIVAINSDKNAPIFQFANIGIVGDMFDVLPMLMRELR